jgi:hypothetical protein
MVRAATLAVFAFTWIFRWLAIDFTNDHFAHLALGRQILLGELPVRDFFDPGTPLLSFAAAASLAVSGQNLLGDAVLTITLVALGAALTFYVAARTSRSMLLALLAAFIAVVLFPRLYNYPKVFLYPLALACVWYYANRRTTAALILLGVVTAIAMLLRLDHGLYIAIAVTVALILANLDQLRTLPAAFARVGGSWRSARAALLRVRAADGRHSFIPRRHPATTGVRRLGICTGIAVHCHDRRAEPGQRHGVAVLHNRACTGGRARRPVAPMASRQAGPCGEDHNRDSNRGVPDHSSDVDARVPGLAITGRRRTNLRTGRMGHSNRRAGGPGTNASRRRRGSQPPVAGDDVERHDVRRDGRAAHRQWCSRRAGGGG